LQFPIGNIHLCAFSQHKKRRMLRSKNGHF
jgi:hypothetical protein